MKDAGYCRFGASAARPALFKKATMAWPPAKNQLTMRLDEDVLAWLKRHGKGYQTRINRILRVVMESQPPQSAIGRTYGVSKEAMRSRMVPAARQPTSRRARSGAGADILGSLMVAPPGTSRD
jgi:hypothetical protein